MMESPHNDLDKIFRQKLEDFEPEPPKDGWEKIEQSVFKKKKSYLSNIWYYGAAASLLFGIVVVYLIYTKPQPNQFDKTVATEVSTQQRAESEPSDEAAVNPVEKPEAAQETTVARAQDSEAKSGEQKAAKLLTVKSGEETRQVVLPDSSKVWLNRNSEIKYREQFTQNRVVSLSGEAFFEVTRDEESAFTVETGNSRIEVLGTSFLVKEGTQDEVFVSEGKVAFYRNPSTKDAPIVLTADMKASTESSSAVEISNNNFLAWKTKNIEFNNTSVQEAVVLMEDYFNTSFDITSPEIEECRFTGTFDDPEPEEILLLIKTTSGINYKKTEQGYLIFGTGCK